MLKITTPCFDEGGWIPDCHAGFGEDQSPEFHIEGIDANAEKKIFLNQQKGTFFKKRNLEEDISVNIDEERNT